MLTILRQLASLISIAALFGCAGPQATPADRITVAEAGEKYEITVAKSKVTLIVPKGDLRQSNDPRRGAAASPRYFFLTGAGSGVNVSGWFEPADAIAALDAHKFPPQGRRLARHRPRKLTPSRRAP